MGASRDEFVLSLPTRGRIPIASRFRSTWVIGSLRALRARGHLDRWQRLVDPQDQALLLEAVPGTWLEASLIVRHYTACDQLELGDGEIFEIGTEVTRHVQGSAVSAFVRAVGTTPWTIFANVDRLWSRIVDGGGISIAKLGPKEARIDLVGFPIAAIRYNRIATRGIVYAFTQVFARQVYVHEETARCGPTTLSYRAQWV